MLIRFLLRLLRSKESHSYFNIRINDKVNITIRNDHDIRFKVKIPLNTSNGAQLYIFKL